MFYIRVYVCGTDCSVSVNFLFNTPGWHLKAKNVLDLRQHVLVHFMRQVSDGQKQIFHLDVRRVATEDDVGGSSSHVLLIDSPVLVVNPVHSLFDLESERKV